MATKFRCPSGDCPTIGVDATALDGYGDVATDDGDRLIFDIEDETAWIQSDLYLPRRSCV